MTTKTVLELVNALTGLVRNGDGDKEIVIDSWKYADTGEADEGYYTFKQIDIDTVKTTYRAMYEDYRGCSEIKYCAEKRWGEITQDEIIEESKRRFVKGEIREEDDYFHEVWDEIWGDDDDYKIYCKKYCNMRGCCPHDKEVYVILPISKELADDRRK